MSCRWCRAASGSTRWCWEGDRWINICSQYSSTTSPAFSRTLQDSSAISAGYTEEADVTRINIVVSVASENELRQVVTQLSKLIDVVKIVNLTQFESITRELVLIKVRATKENRAEIIDVVNIFRARIVDVGVENVVVELTGDAKKIDALSELLSDYGIIEIARTGAIALSRGPVPVKRM